MELGEVWQLKPIIPVLMIFILVLLLGGVIVLGYFLGWYENFFPDKTSENIPTSQLTFNVIDVNSGELLKGNYELFQEFKEYKCLSEKEVNELEENITLFFEKNPNVKGKTFVNESCYLDNVFYKLRDYGVFVDGWNRVSQPSSRTYLLYVQSESYYSNETFIIAENPTQYTSTVFLKKVFQNLSVNLFGKVENDTTQIVRLVLEYDDFLMMGGVCVAWSFNIVRLEFDHPEFEPPSFIGRTDKCWFLNISGMDGFYTDATLTTLDLEEDDFLTFYIIDKDYTKERIWAVSYEGEDVGAKTIVITKDLYNPNNK